MSQENEQFIFYDDPIRFSVPEHETAQTSRELGYMRWLLTLDIQQAVGVINAQQRREIITRALLLRDERLAELTNKSREANQFARTDKLTQLPNRFAFEEKLAELSNSAENFGMLFVDLDHFKSINDAHGHLQGDAVLVETGFRIESAVRQVNVDSREQLATGDRRENPNKDFVARYGGEELVVLFPGVNDLEVLFTKAEKVREAVSGSPYRIDDPFGRTISLDVSLSIGGAIHQIGNDTKLTIQKADTQLYRSKQTGRNRTNIAGFTTK